MVHRSKPPAKTQYEALPHTQRPARAGDIAHIPTNTFKHVWSWLVKRLDITYLVAWVLIIVGAAIFFAAQATSWLQGAGGVIVGTGFTVFITTITGRRAIHEQYSKEANLRRKDNLYGPLYAELRNVRNVLQKACDENGPYPQRIGIGNSAYDGNHLTPPGYEVPTLIQWPAFKLGYYWSDFTESARQVLDRLIELAETYNQAVRDVRDPTIEILAAEIEQTIQLAKASDEYIAWRKTYPTEASWYEAVNLGKAESSWLHRLDFTPPSDMTLGRAWAKSWILSWPIQNEPPTIGFLLAGDALEASRIIHAGYLSGGDPAPPLEWIEGIFKRALPDLKKQNAYRQAHAACDHLYEVVREAERMLMSALNNIQRRYEGGRPPL
jgi:hypothetical protein